MHFGTLELPEPSYQLVEDTRRWRKCGHIFCKLVGLASMPTVPEADEHNQLVASKYSFHQKHQGLDDYHPYRSAENETYLLFAAPSTSLS